MNSQQIEKAKVFRKIKTTRKLKPFFHKSNSTFKPSLLLREIIFAQLVVLITFNRPKLFSNVFKKQLIIRQTFNFLIEVFSCTKKSAMLGNFSLQSSYLVVILPINLVLICRIISSVIFKEDPQSNLIFGSKD